MWRSSSLFLLFYGAALTICEFMECHIDPDLEMEEGVLPDLQFNWLGGLQYIHVKHGNPHYFRVPRVVLIHKRFVISTARDAAEIPPGYALGNVVFAQYERDEDECELTKTQMAKGHHCEPAVLLTPVADVLLHPEYKHFGVKSSVALLKLVTPVRSNYMVPACLPMSAFRFRRMGHSYERYLFYIDFSSDVPRDFMEEDKEMRRFEVLDKQNCVKYQRRSTNFTSKRFVCASGCNVRSGAPSVVRENHGQWNIVTLAEGGPPCPDPLRSRGITAPARHILVHPYVPWITNAIAGKAMGSFAKDDPFGYNIVPRAVAYPKTGRAWIGHWWIGSVHCYDRGSDAENSTQIYQELFYVKPTGPDHELKSPTSFVYYLELSSPISELTFMCVMVELPYQKRSPQVWSMYTEKIRLRIPITISESPARFSVVAFVTNQSDVYSSSSEEYDDYVMPDSDEEIDEPEKPRYKDIDPLEYTTPSDFENVTGW